MAEDLGMITPEVEALRLTGFPGMKVLQFGFSDKGAHIHLPHRFTPELRRLYGHARQRHDAGLVENCERDGARCCQAYLGPIPQSMGFTSCMAVDSRHRDERRADGRCSCAGLARTRLGVAHEYACDPTGNWSWRAPEQCLDG